MTVHLETTIIDIIEGRRHAPVVRSLLRGMSTFFEAGVALRNFAFDRQWIKETKVDVPVVSIGNIIAGGTGKTALIQKLGKDLATSGQISILLRGYRSEIEKVGGSLHLVENSRITPDVCGDEAYLLWKMLPNMTYFIGKDRRLSAQRALYHEADLILLDDGMQYRRLHRDLEIVMLHADDLYGKGFYLPRGYLRDSPKRLAQADYVFINHVDDEAHFRFIQEDVSQKTDAPLIGVQMVPRAIKGREGEILENLEGKRVAAFCGLGKPASFVKTLQKMGLDVAEVLTLPDHTTPSRHQLASLAILAEEKGCEALLCTQKDWVKLPEALSLSLPLGYVEASLEVVVGQSHYRDLLNQMKTCMKGRGHETLD